MNLDNKGGISHSMIHQKSILFVKIKSVLKKGLNLIAKNGLIHTDKFSIFVRGKLPE